MIKITVAQLTMWELVACQGQDKIEWETEHQWSGKLMIKD